MKIEGNKIIFETHAVVCDPNVLHEGYLETIAEDLDPNASYLSHFRELHYMNNDGSWTVEALDGSWALHEPMPYEEWEREVLKGTNSTKEQLEEHGKGILECYFQNFHAWGAISHFNSKKS